MAVLHELLAVEGDREGNAKRILTEARSKFGQPNEFKATIRSYEAFDENDPEVADERTAMVTTVDEKLEYLAGFVGKYYDVVFEKDSANQRATADVVIDGMVLIKDAPVTWLLGMETKLRDVRKTFEKIGTLDAGKFWEADPGYEKANVLREKFPEVVFTTKKQTLHKVLYEATDHHPAQIETWNEDVKSGRKTTMNWSGLISSADKSALLGRADKLIQAFKKARQRANNEKVEKAEVGVVIFDYLFNG